jgi:SSS family solute:Na+ symporter
MSVALIIIFAVIVVSAGVGVYAGRNLKMNLENWTVAGRKFGILLIWLLMAGEIYTTFTFLGASGWAYSKGAPAFYILVYGALAYTLSFFILPVIWRIGKKHRLHTQPDFFVTLFRSRDLGILVAVIGVFSIIPYLQLQLAGLGFIVEVASNGAITSNVAILISFVLTCVFVYTSGIKGAAWVAIIKDVLMITAVFIVGFGVPSIYFGGFAKMMGALMDKMPEHLIFPGSTPDMDTLWVMSTILLTAMGFYMWPHIYGSVFSAKSDKILKRNAIIMPFYQIPILLIFMVGFTALLVIPGLENGDLAFLDLVNKTYPAWFMGFVGAAGAVTAMVPAAILVLFASTLVAKNVYKAGFKPQASEESVLRLSRIMVLVIMCVSLFFALKYPNELVPLLILGYDGVCQFFPGTVLGLTWRKVTKEGVFCGIVVGVGSVVFFIVSGNDPFLGINAGFVGLIFNTIITLAVSLLTYKPGRRVEQTGSEF